MVPESEMVQKKDLTEEQQLQMKEMNRSNEILVLIVLKMVEESETKDDPSVSSF